MADQGWDVNRMAGSFGMRLDVFQRRVLRYGCRVRTPREERLAKLVERWIGRRIRFTTFDFPEWASRAEVAGVLADFCRDGRLVKFGSRKFRDSRCAVYGAPDSVESVPVSDVVPEIGVRYGVVAV